MEKMENETLASKPEKDRDDHLNEITEAVRSAFSENEGPMQLGSAKRLYDRNPPALIRFGETVRT